MFSPAQGTTTQLYNPGALVADAWKPQQDQRIKGYAKVLCQKAISLRQVAISLHVNAFASARERGHLQTQLCTLPCHLPSCLKALKTLPCCPARFVRMKTEQCRAICLPNFCRRCVWRYAQSFVKCIGRQLAHSVDHPCSRRSMGSTSKAGAYSRRMGRNKHFSVPAYFARTDHCLLEPSAVSCWNLS